MADEIKNWLAKFKSLSDDDQRDHRPELSRALYTALSKNRDILVTQQLYDYWKIGNPKMIEEGLLSVKKQITGISGYSQFVVK